MILCAKSILVEIWFEFDAQLVENVEDDSDQAYVEWSVVPQNLDRTFGALILKDWVLPDAPTTGRLVRFIVKYIVPTDRNADSVLCVGEKKNGE